MKFLIYIIFIAVQFQSCAIQINSDLSEISYTFDVPNEELYSQGFRNFDVAEVIKDQSYNLSQDFNTEESNNRIRRLYDFYRPQRNEEKLPLVIFVHPGIFILGDKQEYTSVKICKDLCRRGYAAASINYKLLYSNLDLNALINLSKSCYIGESIMEATVDLYMAVKYFHFNAEALNIDTRNIYIIGYSAGAVIANQFAFSSADELNQFVISKTQNANTIQNILNLNNCIIDDLDIIDQLPTSQLVKGIISISGGIVDFTHVQDSDNLPLLLIYGDKDEMVPAGEGKPFSLLNKDITLDLPGFGHQIALNLNGEGNAVGIDINDNIFIPGWLPNIFRSTFLSKMWGSESIKSLLPSDKCKIIKVKDGPHNLVMTPDGRFNKTYYEIRTRICHFIEN